MIKFQSQNIVILTFLYQFMQQVQIFQDKSKELRLTLHSNEEKLIIYHRDNSLEMTKPPSCERKENKCDSIGKFYSFLTKVPRDHILIVHHQYIIVQSFGQLITLKLRSPQNLHEGSRKVQIIEPRRGLKQTDLSSTFFKDSGFQTQDIDRTGNCMGIILSIFLKNGKYETIYSTCTFIAFNLGIFVESMIKTQELELQYSCMLVSTFEHEVNRAITPMIEYGPITRIICGNKGLNLCQIGQKDRNSHIVSQNSLLFEKIGYLPLRLINLEAAQNEMFQSTNPTCSADKYKIYDYAKGANFQQYGPAFWKYDLYTQEANKNDAFNLSQTPIFNGRLYISSKQKNLVYEALSCKNIQNKSPEHLFSKLFKAYDQIHKANLQIIKLKIVNFDNNEIQKKQTQLINQRQHIYYLIGKYQNKYKLCMANEASRIYYNESKQKRIAQYSRRKVPCYTKIIDDHLGTKLHIRRYPVYRQQNNAIINLQRQAQFRQMNINAILNILKQKKICVEYYLLVQLYKYNYEAYKLDLVNLLRLDTLASSNKRGQFHNGGEVEITQKQATMLINSSQCNHFPIREEMEYKLQYEDDSYIYSLQANLLNQQNELIIRKAFNEKSMAQIYNKFKSKQIASSNIFMGSGLLIIDSQIKIVFNRYKKPIRTTTLITRFKSINFSVPHQQIQIRQSVLSDWKSRKNSHQTSNQTNNDRESDFSKSKIICIWENIHTKQLMYLNNQAYFIGINGVISKISIKDDLRLLSAWVYIKDHSKYLKISEFVSSKGISSFVVGMLEDLQTTSRISSGYLGLKLGLDSNQQIDKQSSSKPEWGFFKDLSLGQLTYNSYQLQDFSFYIDSNQYISETSSDNSKLNAKFQQHLKIAKKKQPEQLPFITVNSADVLNQLKVSLSMLSDFQIFSEKIVEKIADNISQEICKAYESRRKFQEQFENQTEFKKALNKNGNRYFFQRRNKAIEEYRKIISLHEELYGVVQDYKKYSNVDLQMKTKQKLIKDYQINFNLGPLQIENNQRNRLFNMKTYDVNQNLSGQLSQILKEKTRLEEKKCFVEAHLLQRVLEKMVHPSIKDKQLQKTIYLTQTKFENQQYTKDNIPFYSHFTEFKLPKISFHSILAQSKRQVAKLHPQIKFQQKFDKAITQLLGFDVVEYQHLVDSILKEPISKNEKNRSLQLLFEFYEHLKIDRPLNAKEQYMKYLFHIYSTLRLNFIDHEYFLLNNRQSIPGQALDDNEIKTKLSLMQLISNYTSKQSVENYVIQMNIPSHAKLEIIDFQQYIQFKLGDSLNNVKIQKINYIKRQLQEEGKIKLFIKSLIQQPQQFNSINSIQPDKQVTRGFISIQNFDYIFNYTYNPEYGSKQVEMRGGYPFYQASKCIKLALKSIGRYDNDDWLLNNHNPGEYAIAYHGISQPLRGLQQTNNVHHECQRITDQQLCQSNATQRIIRGGLMPGTTNLFQDSGCLVHENEQVGRGIYFSPSFQVSFTQYAAGQNYSTVQIQTKIQQSFQKQSKIIRQSPISKQSKESQIILLQQVKNYTKSAQKYSIIFMNRLNPDKIHIFDRNDIQVVGDEKKHLYWVVNNWEDCRTYAVLLINTKEADQYPTIREEFGETFNYQKYQHHIQSWIRNRKYIPHPSQNLQISNRQNLQSPQIIVSTKPKQRKICQIY